MSCLVMNLYGMSGILQFPFGLGKRSYSVEIDVEEDLSHVLVMGLPLLVVRWSKVV